MLLYEYVVGLQRRRQRSWDMFSALLATQKCRKVSRVYELLMLNCFIFVFHIDVLYSGSRRSGRQLGRVALPTVQRRLALSGKLCFSSVWPVTNVRGQGTGLRSWIVREKRGGPQITVKAKQTKKTNAVVLIFVSTPLPQAAPQLGHVLRPPRHPDVSQGRLMGWEFVSSGFCLFLFVFLK